MKNIIKSSLLLCAILAFTSCSKGTFKCTCEDANGDLSHQSTMEGPEQKMSETCKGFEGSGGNQGLTNESCSLSEQ